MVYFLHFIGWLFYPVSVCLLLLALGLVLLWLTNRQRAGRILITVAFLLLLLASLGVPGDYFLQQLEWAYPVMPVEELQKDPSISHVVVLSAGYSPDPAIPLSARPAETYLVRFVEGIRICRALPKSKLIVSVSKAVGPHDTRVRDMEELAQALGMRAEDVTIVEGALTTTQEADLLRDTLKDHRFALVTSASHIPRAMVIFQRRGLDPVAVPTGHLTTAGELGLLDLLPSQGGLRRTQAVVYEGLAWAKMRFFP